MTNPIVRSPSALPRTPTTRLGRRLARQPHWWLFVVASIGWMVLAGHDLVRLLPGWAGASAHAEHVGHVSAPAGSAAISTVGWFAMIAAMAPMIAPSVRYAALRSPQQLRRAVTYDVVGGWAVVWALAAAGIGLVCWVLVNQLGAAVACLVAGAVAVLWQNTELKRRSLARCHRVLAPPLARSRSRSACWRHGVQLGRSCVLSCGPLMAVMAVAGHSVVAALPLVGVAWYERFRRSHHDPGTALTSVVIAATSLGAAAVIGLGLDWAPSR